MNLSQFRALCLNEVPVDTGYMLTNGFIFYETPTTLRMDADITSVPYIVYNEEGTVFSTANQGFISQGMVGAINKAVVKEANGMDISPEHQNREEQIRKKSLIMNSGAIQKIG